MGITVKDLNMVFTYEEHTYRLMTRSDDDCVQLILISDDYEMTESKCLNNMRLYTVINFLRMALQH